MEPPASIIRGQNYISKSLKNASSQAVKKYENYSLKNGGPQGRHFVEETPRGIHKLIIWALLATFFFGSLWVKRLQSHTLAKAQGRRKQKQRRPCHSLERSVIVARSPPRNGSFGTSIEGTIWVHLATLNHC